MNDDAVAGAFEELPALMVVLVAISLFSVSVAHAVNAWSEGAESARLGEDCLAFASMVRSSETLAGPGGGDIELSRLMNATSESFMEEFDPESLGFGYRVTVNCLDLETGNSTWTVVLGTGEMPDGASLATVHTCANVLDGEAVGASRIAVTIWEVTG
jgi:hypothetical protein